MNRCIVKIVGGKPVVFGEAGGNDGDAPVYIFEEEETFDAALAGGLIPVGALIVKTYDEVEMAGGPFDDALSDESENAVQNKVLTPYITGIRTMDDPISFNGGAGFHNKYRGKYLGERPTPEQYAAIADQTFKSLFVGDYWIKNGITWRISHFNYWMHTGDSSCETPHAVIVPDQGLYSAQMRNTPSGGFEEGSANTTEGGYIGSDMYKTGLDQAKSMIDNVFGSEHILNHRELLVNSVVSGKPYAGAWYDSTVELMNEPMVYGSHIFTAASDGTVIAARHTIDRTQLALFGLRPDLICNRANWWLRDVVSDFWFANVTWDGLAANNSSTDSVMVRPVFGIC